MTAAAGTDPKMWRDGVGIFTPGTPMESKTGMDIIAGPKRDLPTLRKALRDAGYQGERIVYMAPSDQAVLTAQGAVALDLLQKLGMDVDYAVMDWGTLVQRRASKEPPSKGGWNMFITGWAGLDMTTPITNQTLRSNGAKAWFGWPDLPPVQTQIDAWLEAPDVATQQRIASEIQSRGAGTGALCTDRSILLSHRLSQRHQRNHSGPVRVLECPQDLKLWLRIVADASK